MSNFGPDDARTALAAARRVGHRQNILPAATHPAAALDDDASDSVAVPKELETFIEDPMQAVEDLGMYDWNGTWFAIQRAEERFLQGRKCRGVPVHYRNTVRNLGGILVEEMRAREKAERAAKKDELRAHAKRSILHRRGLMRAEAGRRSAAVARSAAGSIASTPARQQAQSVAGSANGASVGHRSFARSISPPATATPRPVTVPSGAMQLRLQALAGRPMTANNAFGTQHTNSQASVMLYDGQGNPTRSWPLRHLPNLHDQSTCGSEGFISHKMYKPPTAGDIEHPGLAAYRSYLVKRNRILLVQAGCCEELREDVIERALEEDTLGWDAVFDLAKNLAGERAAEILGLIASPADILEDEAMTEDGEEDDGEVEIKMEDNGDELLLDVEGREGVYFEYGED